MIFRLTADFTFEATDIDHAFTVLRKHFEALEEGEDEKTILSGEIKVEPEKTA